MGRALSDHRSRFVAAARRTQGDARLGHWILAWQSGMAFDAATAAEAREAVQRACGLDISTDRVDPERLDP